MGSMSWKALGPRVMRSVVAQKPPRAHLIGSAEGPAQVRASARRMWPAGSAAPGVKQAWLDNWPQAAGHRRKRLWSLRRMRRRGPDRRCRALRHFTWR